MSLLWRSTILLVLFACVCAVQGATDSLSESASDSSSGSTGDIYNVCPVTVDFTKEQDSLSDAEIKANAADAAMSAYMLSHPNNTLWDYFKIETKAKREMYKNLPLTERIKKRIMGFIDYTTDTIVALGHNIASAIEWIINTIRDPLVGAKQVVEFFKEFGNNCKALWALIKENPKETGENMAGGLLLHIMHHPSEFTAETVLMVSGGFAVIHGLMAGVKAVFGSMSNVISKVLMSVLMFIHAIDDPIYIVTPLVTQMVKTADTIEGDGANVTNSTDDDVLTVDIIQPLKACKIPKEYRPKFSSRDLCLSTPAEIRNLIFGTAKRSAKMTQQERIAAYNHFHDFVCCYLQDQSFEVNAPKLDSTAFEAELVATPVKMTNCSHLLGNYSADDVWISTVSDDEATSLNYDSTSGEE